MVEHCRSLWVKALKPHYFANLKHTHAIAICGYDIQGILLATVTLFELQIPIGLHILWTHCTVLHLDQGFSEKPGHEPKLSCFVMIWKAYYLVPLCIVK